MRGASRDALKRALERFEESIGAVTSGQGAEGAGSSEVSDGLYAVAALLDREPSLRRAFADPASSPQARVRLAEQLLGGQLPPLPLSVVRDLVRERWNDPADLRTAVETLAATAALRAAEGEGKLDDVEDELFRFARLLEREPALRAALTDPGLPDGRKIAILDQLLGGKAQPTTVRLVQVATTRSHGRSLEKALDDLVQLAAQRRSQYVATVRSAVPLTPQQEQRLVGSLAGIYGRAVQLQVDVDPSVLGGVEVRVGDEVLDGTVSRKLAAARRRLAG
jgi:F-type H+-transporting ATPase subunit delta